MLNRILAALALAGALLCASCVEQPAYAATTAGLQPFFAQRLTAFLASIPGTTIMSGYRSPGTQAMLYVRARQRYGRGAARMVAPPGQSMHNFGLAADLHFQGPGMRAAAHLAAARFGLVFPMGYEPWHVEPAAARALAYAPISPIAAAAAAIPWPIGHHVVHLVSLRHKHHVRHHGARRAGHHHHRRHL